MTKATRRKPPSSTFFDTEAWKTAAATEIEHLHTLLAFFPPSLSQDFLKKMEIHGNQAFTYYEYLQRLRSLAASGINVPFRTQKQLAHFASNALTHVEGLMAATLEVLNELEESGLLVHYVRVARVGLAAAGTIGIGDLLRDFQSSTGEQFGEVVSYDRRLFNKAVDYLLAQEFSDGRLVTHELGIRLESKAGDDFPLVATTGNAQHLITPEQLCIGRLPPIRYIKEGDVWVTSLYELSVSSLWGGIYGMRQHVDRINRIGVQPLEAEPPAAIAILVLVVVVGIAASLIYGAVYYCEEDPTGEKRSDFWCYFFSALSGVYLIVLGLLGGKYGKDVGWDCASTGLETTCRPYGW